MRILLCMGTRPEIIKMLPLYFELRKHKEIEAQICFSGQHDEIAKELFEYFNVEPDFSFCVMMEGQSLSELNVKLLNYFDVVISREKPDAVLVHGDTATAFSASLAAFYRGIKIGHVESGLRTYRTRNPFPEEMFRVSIDAMADYHFAPTNLAKENLEKEGRKSVFTVGNTVIDTFKYTIKESYSSPLLDSADGRKIVLVTTHRRENLGEKMQSALLGIADALRENEKLFCILPVHPNPAIRSVVERVFCDVKNIKICNPLPIFDFHNILSRSFAALTDSGGIQEEASYLGVPILIMRETTERQEAIEEGNARLIGTDRARVRDELISLSENLQLWELMRKPSTAFGDGFASEKIVKTLLKNFKF